jgi:hypothetical protein
LLAGYANDLYSFDPAISAWTLLSVAVTAGNALPTARAGHGFASAGGKLYVHGGFSAGERVVLS